MSATGTEQPLLPSDPSSKPVASQPDILEKGGDMPVQPPAKEAEIIDDAAVKKAEEEALKAKRDPVPATSVGWKQIGEWEEKDALTTEDELMDLTTPSLLDSYMPDAAYGDWYHTVGVYIGAGLLSFIVGWFNFSIAPVFFIVVGACVYYRTSIKKYRSVVRDQIQREFTIKHIENEYETMDWLNTFLEKYWIFLEPSISQIVTEQANPIIASQSSIPAFVKAVWIDQFTAGTKPPRVDFVKTLNIPKDDVVVMDWAFSFTPHDNADNSAKQLKNHVNQRVVVKASLFGLTIPVVVENVAFKAWARVRLRMTTKFPHVETINISMMEPPQFDFVSRVFGESVFNWEILAIPGLYPLINEMIKKFAGPMLFQPFSFQLNVPQLLAGSNTSVGILTLKVRSAKNLSAADRVMGNTVDPYLSFNFNGQPVAAKTKTIMDTSHPVWNETVHILVGSFSEPLIVTAFDYNDDRKDKNIGRLQIDMEEITEKKSGKNCVGELLRNLKPCGEILYDYEFNPTLEPVILEDGSTESAPDLNTGLTKIELTEVRNISTEAGKKLSSYTELYFNDELVKTTKVAKNNDNPTFSIPYETIVTDRRKAKVKILVKDPKGKIISGSVQSLNTLIDRTEIDSKWAPFSKGDGEFCASAVWKSVEMKGVPGTGGYTEPIGTVRVLFNKAESLRNLEALGKVDPYGRVLVNGIQRARTDFIESTLDPVWNESLWITVTSPNQKLTIEVMDAEKSGNDRTLGSFNIKTSDIIQKNDEDQYIEHVDKELRTGRLVHKKGPKGVLTYALSFYPTIPVKSLEDLEEEAKAKELKAKEAAEKAALEAKGETKVPEKKKEEEEEEEEFEITNKIEMSLDQLLEHQTGVFVYTILAGEYSAVNTYLQVYFDDKGYADHISPLIHTKNVVAPNTGDAVVKELEWSTINFRLVKKKDNNRAGETIAESTLPTLSLLKNTYNQPNILTLTGMGNTKLKIQAQWIPIVASRLPPSDLITNAGTLDLDIISANGLASADSNGKSDPFIKLYINDEEDNVFKTKTIKKTLDPEWNESTSFDITNRVNTVLRFKVLDWDFGAGQDDKLGDAYLDLADIDPVTPSSYDVEVKGEDGEPAGVLHLKTAFRPAYIVTVKEMKTKINPADGLKSVGTGIGAGLGAGKSVLGTGVGVVGKVKKGIFGGKKDKDEE